MRVNWIVILASTLLIAGVAAGLFLSRSLPAPAGRRTTSPVRPKEFTCTAAVEPQQIVIVPAPSDGIVEALNAAPGDRISEGQPLASIKNVRLAAALESANAETARQQTHVNTIESELIEARLEQSRAAADLARSHLEHEGLQKAFQRQQALAKEGATPRLVYEKAEQDFASAEQDLQTKEAGSAKAAARVTQLESDLSLSTNRLTEGSKMLDNMKAQSAVVVVQSPTEGILLRSGVHPGDPVSGDTRELFAIAVHPMLLQASCETASGIRVVPGQAVQVRLSSETGTVTGSVKELKGTRLTAAFQTASVVFRPGLTAQILLH